MFTRFFSSKEIDNWWYVKYFLFSIVFMKYSLNKLNSLINGKILFQTMQIIVLYFNLRPGPKILFQGNTPEGSDTFQRPVIERDRVGGLRLMIWDKVKVLLCHYSHAPEESNLWTAWLLFPLDDD